VAGKWRTSVRHYPTGRRNPQPPHPTDFRLHAHTKAAPHSGQSAPAGGRQHAHPHPATADAQ
jgi:hypothetical protein